MFSDAFIKKISPYMTIQESTTVCDNIYPVYIGSGNVVLPLDATGMQGLNNRVQRAYGGYPDAADMYVVGQAMVGDVLSPNNTIPFGYFDYSIELDGKTYSSQDILEYGSMFSRKNDIRRATVTTSYILNSALCVEIHAFAPYGTDGVVFRCRFKNYVPYQYSTDEIRSVCLRVFFKLKTRQGKPIFDKVSYESGKAHVSVRGHENYERTIFCSEDAVYDDEAISLERRFSAGKEWTEYEDIAFSFGSKLPSGDPLPAHVDAWKSFFKDCPRVESPCTEEEFLFNNSLYLLHAGYNERFGYPIGHPFYFPGCWNQCMFWDMFFIADAFLRGGRVGEAFSILDILKKSMRTEGKPFPWMFIYDGVTFLDDKRDIAPLVIAAHAMTAIKYYEVTLDREALKSHCYPIIKTCSEYALDHLFGKDEKGRYIVSLPISNDVVEEEGEETNQTFTTLWFLTLLEKASEYAPLLKEEPDPRIEEILANFYLEREEEEYLHCKWHKAADFRWASWLPFLAYPTEGMRFLDMELLRKTREKYSYTELYMLKQNCYQPWTECIEAQAAHRTDENERAYALLRTAISHTFGDGYFSEVGPQQQTCGYPPYISAHGAYISAYIDMFFSADIWERKGSLFFHLPERFKDRRFKIGHMRAVGGLTLIEAEYEPSGIRATLENVSEGFALTMPIPPEVDSKYLCLYVNGERLLPEINVRKGFVKVKIPACQTCELELY